VEKLGFAYNGAIAVDGISLAVGEGEAVALLGANGAGKSTSVKVIAGAEKAQRGSVVFDGRAIGGRGAHEIVEAGITLVPEGRLVFPRLTVMENLEMGAYAARAKKSFAGNLERVFAIFPRLAERREQQAGLMSGGEQQMLAIGRGLMSAPRLLILDEPSLGLQPSMVEHIFELIQTIRSLNISLIVVEQNVHRTLDIVDRAYVLEKGRVTIEGSGQDLAQNDQVRRSFLGL
jgi:branched-chain amino acid transport system ATP-binding protein